LWLIKVPAGTKEPTEDRGVSREILTESGDELAVPHVQRGGTPGPPPPVRGCRRANVCSSRWQVWCCNTGERSRSGRRPSPFFPMRIPYVLNRGARLLSVAHGASWRLASSVPPGVAGTGGLDCTSSGGPRPLRVPAAGCWHPERGFGEEDSGRSRRWRCPWRGGIGGATAAYPLLSEPRTTERIAPLFSPGPRHRLRPAVNETTSSRKRRFSPQVGGGIAAPTRAVHHHRLDRAPAAPHPHPRTQRGESAEERGHRRGHRRRPLAETASCPHRHNLRS
jgi:hypothetical protein